jgi:hypothetical protein
VFIEDQANKGDINKYNYVCSSPQYRCRGYLDSFMTLLKYKCDGRNDENAVDLKPDPGIYVDPDNA